MSGASLHGEATPETVELTPGLRQRCYVMLEMPELWEICQGELTTWYRTSPRERGVLQSTKPGGADNLKSALTSSIEMQTLEFFTLFFSPALV